MLEAQKWKVHPDDVPTLWDAQKAFDEDIRIIEENRRTGMVTVAIEGKNPLSRPPPGPMNWSSWSIAPYA